MQFTSSSTLDLSNNQLAGNVPVELFNLNNLQTLNLSNNQFTSIESGLNTNSSVRSLYLQNNQLAGNVPAELFNLNNLQTLHLSNNQFTSIESGLNTNSSVRSLDLQNNQLAGNVPAELFNLNNLQTLYLSNNQFTSIESGLNTNSSVRSLYLQNNQLAGNVPAELFNLNNLQTLYLSNNQFTSIESGLNTNSSVRSLYLQNNQLAGNVPAELFNLNNLQTLYLSNNQFTSISRINTSSNLRYLDLSNNQFSGSLPGALLFLSNLEQLRLTSNQLTSIPSGPYGLLNMRYLYLDDNQLGGTIPKDLFNLSNLQGLNLSNNYFTSIESGTNIASTNLSQIDLSSNQLSGSIPVELFNWSSANNWGELNLSNNYFTSIEAGIDSSSTAPSQINLSNNQLNGSIPKELFNGANLHDLNLSNNYFTSVESGINIVSTGLYRIDLNTNQLTDSIPAELLSWPSNNSWGGLNLANNFFTAIDPIPSSTLGPRHLYLSNNLLSTIPADIGNLTNLEELYWSNNGLTTVPIHLLNLSNLHTLSLSNNQLSSPFLDHYPTSLQRLNLSGNQLDTIPSQIQNFPNLSGLYWSNNRLTTFPNQLLNLSNLIDLSLGGNELNTIPSSISTLSNLSSLDWSNNGLTNLPTELFNLNNLQKLDLSNNQLSIMPADLLAMQNLNNLDLSFNQISGTIPTNWGNFPAETWGSGLNLAGNQLTGHIPPELGSLSFGWGDGIDLSLNQLTGAVPPELGNITYLRALKLCDNQLSGILPTSLTQLHNLETFSYGNNNLTEPSDAVFQNWLANIDNLSSTGTCNPIPYVGKTASVDMASPGEMIEYTIAISLTNGNNFTNTSLIDVLPSGLTYVNGSLSIGAVYDNVNRQILYTPKNTSVVISYQVTVDAEVAPGTVFQNMAILQTENARIERAATVAVPNTIPLQTLVLIYASGDNNLGTDMVRLLNNAEMQADNPNVITLMVMDGPGDGDSYLYHVQHDTDPSCPHYGDFTCDFTGNNPLYVEGETVWNWPENVASPHNLAGFIKGAMWAYPNVDQVILSLVGHGNGWSPNAMPGQPGQWDAKPNEDILGGMLWDLDPGDSLSSLGLQTGLDWAKQATGRKIDLIYMDACSMAASEVAYEVRNYAEYLLASENTSWASFAYDKHLQAIDGTTTPDQIGQSWLETESQLFREGGYPFTMSLVDLSKIDDLRSKEDAFATALIDQLNSDLTTNQTRLQNARNVTACFESNYDGAIDNLDSYCDLSSFAKEVENQYTHAGIDVVISAAQELQTAVGEAVILEDHDKGEPWPYPGQFWQWGDLGGLTKYLPLDLNNNEWKRRFYNEDHLQMAKDGLWDEFLTAYWDSAEPPSDTPVCPPTCDELGEPLPLRPEVSIEVDDLIAQSGDSLSVPVAFDNYEQEISSVGGSITFDTTCLEFNSMSFDIPSDFNPSQNVNGNTIEFTVADQTAPIAALPADVVATIDFSVICNPTTAMTTTIEFTSVSFGDINGQPVVGSGLPATIEIVPPVSQDEIIVDNKDAAINGDWISSQVISGYYNLDYLHDGNTGQGSKSVTFTPNIPEFCTYEVYARWTAHPNRDTNVPIDIHYEGDMTTVFVNQQIDGGQWNLLGTYPFAAGTVGAVTVRNDNTTGHVIADAVRFVEVSGSCTTLEQASLYLSPTLNIIKRSEAITVGVYISNITGLYGIQFDLDFDPSTVEVTDNSIQPGPFLIPDTTIHNAVDNNRGRIRYAVSLQGNKPGVNGSGLLGTIGFRGLVPGTSPLTFVKSVLGDPNSQAITHIQKGAFISVSSPVTSSPTVTVTGQLILERRGENNNDGARVCAGSICITTGEDGFYTLPKVPLTETVVITHQSYLSTSHIITDVSGSVVTLPTVTLLGGDINQDGVIDAKDGVLAGLAWGSTPTDSRWDPRADVTDDSMIDILDMIAVQFNLNETNGRKSPNLIPRQVSQASLTFSPMVSTMAEVGTFTDVDIVIEEITDMYGYSFILTFNPEVVQIVDDKPNEAGVQVALGDFLDPLNQFVLINQVDNVAGRIELAVTQTYPAEAQSGGGILNTLPFKVVGEGSSDLRFDDVQLLDDSTPEPQEIPANTPQTHRLFLPVINR